MRGRAYTGAREASHTFTFGPFATIQQACEGVTPWLNIAVTATVDGDTLTVCKSDGGEIGTLGKR